MSPSGEWYCRKRQRRPCNGQVAFGTKEEREPDSRQDSCLGRDPRFRTGSMYLIRDCILGCPTSAMTRARKREALFCVAVDRTVRRPDWSPTGSGYSRGWCATQQVPERHRGACGSTGSSVSEPSAAAVPLECEHSPPAPRSQARRSKAKKPPQVPRRRLPAQADDSRPTRAQPGQSALALAS